jgi:RNA polymerase sigma-70 factor (ECF subfamily)
MSGRSLEQASIEELIERARDGDQSALEVLFNRCRPMIRASASKKMGSSRRGAASASDVTQETMKHAFMRFATFRGASEGEWKSWLNKILVNCLNELTRAAGRQKRDDRGTVSLDDPEAGDVPAPEKSPSQAAAHREEQDQLVIYLWELPSDQGRAILYYYLDGLPVAEVAEKMKKSPEAVWGLLQRGIKALRRRMSDASVGDTRDGADAALLTYLRRRDAGEDVDRGAFLAEHAACADELRSMLDFIDLILAIWNAPPVREE